MNHSDQKPYYSLNQYYKEFFGQKTYKISLDIHSTCPNRDGTLDTRGCIFCSAQGSGDFASSLTTSIEDQISNAKQNIANKNTSSQYIAYFQSFTNTYGSIEKLRQIYMEVIHRDDICGLSIATRPDCLSQEVLILLKDLVAIKPVWVELGLQTIHEATAILIRRCYELDVFDKAMHALHLIQIPVVVHLIAGLPYETQEDFLKSVRYVNQSKVNGVKLQLLHILKNTDLENLFSSQAFETLTLEAYVDTIVKAIGILDPKIVIHRLTGDGMAQDLIAPQWSSNKRNVLNQIHKSLKTQNIWQGKLLNSNERRQIDER